MKFAAGQIARMPLSHDAEKEDEYNNHEKGPGGVAKGTSFMDPLEASLRWRRWVVDGAPEQIDRVLASLDAVRAAGWRRLTGPELVHLGSLVKNGSAWYGLEGTAMRQTVAISLDRVAATELRGGSVWFEGMPLPGPAPKVTASWNNIMRFLDEDILPAARAAGAKVRLPSAEDVFFAELPFDVGNRLKLFSDRARKALPLDREEAERWHEFVVAAFRFKTFIDANLFVRWFVANGWQAEAAKELCLRFFDESLLLSRFTDEALTV